MGGFIWGFTGPEGSGKSCCMTSIGLTHGILLSQAAGYKSYEQYCLENRPVVMTFPGYELHSQDNQIKLSSPIDIKAWLKSFGADEFRNMLVSVDEVQNFLDSAVSGAVFARILSHAMAQRRRVGLGLMYTVQNWEWTHKRIRWVTHMLSMCYDLYWTPWGKAEGVKRGELLRIITFDCKGFYTGQPWTPMSRKLLIANRVWPFFDSFTPSDIYSGETKYILKRPEETIDLRSDEEQAAESHFNRGLEAMQTEHDSERGAEEDIVKIRMLRRMKDEGKLSMRDLQDIGRVTGLKGPETNDMV